MKPKVHELLLPLLAGALFLLPLSGCDKSNGAKHYTFYEPIYTSRADALARINGNPTEGIDSAGKVYINGNYIFLSDVDKGIHVFDNTNPSHPVQVAFLSIPGNQDIVVRGNTLYADMYDALLAVDISDLSHVKVTRQLEHLFVMRAYVNGYGMPRDSVITGWTKKYSDTPPRNGSCYWCTLPGVDLVPMAFASSKSSGLAGSMAKIVLLKDHLYALAESHSLQIIDLDNADQPSAGPKIMAGFDLETVFPFQDKLFLGSSSGVYIYDVSSPDNPVAEGTFAHGRACDPVITDGDYAYVTLHSGGMCGGASNELNVLDVKDLKSPALVKAYTMSKPMGLSKDGDLLFVCDGPGVKVFRANNPGQLQYLKTIILSNAYDVIASNKHLLVTADEGIYQFDYSKQGMPLLSILPVAHHSKG
ncbi:hypothetical protein Q4E93_23635 [Flavitalea sp. BT771]|uniref:LVIVD repeat-containing protein n=1 Tax=Flavitalea sp. BT771 TaxID=3063329 RepID=UPI0026E47552|nr:hypothetical protein [Flavitalea sp. BT771]MDO6433624.1 hypothetical protein [Flavitalea sp. BT771]MDV6222471.1 hypothetical protein [Flavitalea sp. BT771]